MKKFLKGAFLAAGVLLGGALGGQVTRVLPAWAAGFLTNGLPTIGASTQNGVTMSAPFGVLTLPQSVSNSIPVDTNLANGAAPQTVKQNSWQIATAMLGAVNNTATSTVHAATLNTLDGTITTESLSTAAGATYTFTLTNSLITSTTQAPPYIAVNFKSATQGSLVLTSVTNANGSSVWVFTNNSTVALNGTILIAFHV